MNNKKLSNNTLLFLDLFSYYLTNINTLIPSYLIYNYFSLLKNSNVSTTCRIEDTQIGSSKFTMLNRFCMHYKQKNVFFIFKEVGGFLVNNTKTILENFSTKDDASTKSLVLGWLHIKKIEKNFTSIFKKIKLKQVMFYLSKFIKFKIFTYQYFDRESSALLFQSYNY